MNDERNDPAALSPGEHLGVEDLMLYVLEHLSPEARRIASAHLESCEQCRAELAGVEEALGAYALDVVTMEDAPARSRERLLAAVEAAGRSGAVVPFSAARQPGIGGVAGLGMAAPAAAARSTAGAAAVVSWLGWALAAGVALAAVHFYQGRESLRESVVAQAGQIERLSSEEARAREVVDALTNRSAQRVTLTLTKAPAPPQPSGRATYIASRGTLIFVASHLDPLPAGKTYQLWVIPSSGAAPLPAGTFKPDERGNATVLTASLQGAVPAKAFGVTIEPAGGSRTPTLPIVLAGS